MIVKDESHIIERTLSNLCNYIDFSYWVISDTGSTDSTKDLIRDFFKKRAIPGMLTEDIWNDFGHNRTVALQHAYNRTDYVFVWDADDEIQGDFVLPDSLHADSYKFQFTNMQRSQMFNNRKRWMYKGVLHEYVTNIDPVGPAETILGKYRFVSGRSGNRNKDPELSRKDAELLEQEFTRAFHKKDPIYCRYAFYCANSYKSAHNYEKAIEFYRKVLSFHNWSEEKYVSCYSLFDALEAQGKAEFGLQYLVKAYSYNPNRVEAILRLVKYYCVENMEAVSYMYYTLIQDSYETMCSEGIPTENWLFRNIDDITFSLPYYMIIVSQRTGHYETGIKMYEIICKYANTNVPQDCVDALFFNAQLYVDAVQDNKFYTDLVTYAESCETNNRTVDKILLGRYKLKIYDTKTDHFNVKPIGRFDSFSNHDSVANTV